MKITENQARKIFYKLSIIESRVEKAVAIIAENAIRDLV
jgi:hypothetical protein